MDIYNEEATFALNESMDSVRENKEKSNIILFLSGKIISLLGSFIYNFAVSLYILKVTGSGSSFALSILIGILPRVILGPFAGSLSDRADKKKMIVVMDFLSGAVVLAILPLSMLYGMKLIFIYSVNFLLAVLNTFFNTCLSSVIPRLVTDKKLVKINSYSTAVDSGSQIIGPVLAGMIFGIVSMELFLVINGISFIVSAVMELFIDFNFNKQEQEGAAAGRLGIRTVIRDAGEVLAFIKHNELLKRLMPFSVSFNFLISAILSVSLPFLLNRVIGLSPAQLGVTEGSIPVGMLIASIVIGKLPEKEKKRKGLVYGVAGMGICLILMGVPGLEAVKLLNKYIIFAFYIILLILFALFLLMVDLPLTVVVQRSIPANMMGRVMGLWGSITSSLSPVGIILAGLALDLIPAYILFMAAGIYIFLGAVMLNRSRALKNY